MEELRQAFIMAYLVNHGKIKRQMLMDAFGVSGRTATNEMQIFERNHGNLDRGKGAGHWYRLPPDYDTTMDLERVNVIVDEIVIFSAKNGAGE